MRYHLFQLFKNIRFLQTFQKVNPYFRIHNLNPIDIVQRMVLFFRFRQFIHYQILLFHLQLMFQLFKTFQIHIDYIIFYFLEHFEIFIRKYYDHPFIRFDCLLLVLKIMLLVVLFIIFLVLLIFLILLSFIIILFFCGQLFFVQFIDHTVLQLLQTILAWNPIKILIQLLFSLFSSHHFILNIKLCLFEHKVYLKLNLSIIFKVLPHPFILVTHFLIVLDTLQIQLTIISKLLPLYHRLYIQFELLIITILFQNPFTIEPSLSIAIYLHFITSLTLFDIYVLQNIFFIVLLIILFFIFLLNLLLILFVLIFILILLLLN